MSFVRRLSCLALVVGLSTLTLPAWGSYLRIYYPDIEQGSSTLVVSPTGNALLIDAGSELNPADDDMATYVLDLIDAGIVTSLDYVIATHYDEDHIGRLEQVLEYGGASPSVIAYDRGTFFQTPSSFAYSDYAWAASQKTRSTITPFTDIALGGGVVVECYTVNGDLRDGSTVDVTGSGQFENSAAVSVVVRYGNFDVWIGGDLTGNPDQGVTDVESEVAPLVGDVDIYTFNHHGSRTSSNATFLSTLKAEVGISQNSAGNGFGHPNTETVTRFLGTNDSFGMTPIFIQQNPGNPTDTRSDDTLATAIADPDDVDEPFGLPGTMTVISDGDSYQIFGGAMAPIELPADSGLGTLADFPPAVLATSRSPLVPAASQAVTVSTDVVDSGAVSVYLDYDLDGVAQTPIAMTSGGGTSYSGSIPGQADGTQVRFRVRAVDALSQVGLSAAQGYYAGVTPISTFRVNDSDGVLVPKHFGVRIEGNVTAEPGLFNGFVSQIFVQDSTAGVQIFDRTLLPLSRGDVAQFVGELEQFGGATELNMSQDFGNYGHTFVSSGSAAAPQPVTVADVDESLEGLLIRIDGLSVVSGDIPEQGSGSLTVTDDGGLHTLTLRIDGETDLPGSPTPTLTFDLIGIAGQFDGSFPFTSGYQVTPREKADVLSDEINLPLLLINEIHADPDATAGDANGDGSVSSTQDEFIELVNTGFEPLDISGFYLSDDTQVRHVFPAGTIVPAREAVVVFGGGSPTGDFGNAGANGLVFTASSGRLGLNNGGDTVTLYDDGGVVLQAVTYGSEGGQNESLVRDPDLTNTPFELHSQVTASGGALYSPGTLADGTTFTVGVGQVLLTEVLYDPSGADGGLEWIEIYNATDHAIDLGGMSLGGGGSNYTSTLVQLAGVLASGQTLVIGGPDSTADNANPTIDLPITFSPGLQNSGSTADGVALFNLRAARITPTTVPIDAVVYGTSNTSGLIDETGVANAPEVGDASSGASIERIDLAGTWQIQTSPTPNSFSAGSTPPPSGVVILSEVFYDPSGADDGLEWVELYNPGTVAVDLSGYSLGGGGSDYTYTTLQLSGTIGAGQTFVVGGATSNATNYNPVFDQTLDFSPDLQNSGSTADGVALFDVPASSVTSSTVPVDAVVYGTSNTSGLIDETGSANAPEVGDAPTGSSIERTDLAGTWQIQSTPTPNATPLP
ncbi:MAG: lamin tail domain-containing protein [Acidobacteria bacterium]|nr:lamin tail domain-containing protein [Acidobacteriota bacterium]